MDFHDYRLRGYQVSHLGSVITLDLVYDYPQQPKRESMIRFEGVRLYHFVHSAVAIITDIDEEPLAEVLKEHATEIESWAVQQGVNDWRSGIAELISTYSEQGLRAWTINSAIGFVGFVIASAVG
jgi:hypothetical protein